MANLAVTYLGLELKNPVIVSSSGLTSTAEKIQKCEAMGAAAVVMKSIFEEQINFEVNDLMRHNAYPEAEDYIRTYTKNNAIETYLKTITEARKLSNIPVIASINCISPGDWAQYACKMEDAGANGIELNIHIIPTRRNMESHEIEDIYVNIISNVVKNVHIPVSVKIGSHFSNILSFTDKLAMAGAKGVVFFNRFYEPDIDIENMRFIAADIFSKPNELRHNLRWVGLTAGRVPFIDISASTGVHDGNGVVKLLLAGAQSVQVCSAIYEGGYEVIGGIIRFLNAWMDNNGFTQVSQFKGRMSYAGIDNPAAYERAQFMRYFSNTD